TDLPGDMADAAHDCAKQVAELVGAFNLEDYVPLCRGWDLQGLGRRTRGVHAKFDALLETMIKNKGKERREVADKANAKDLLDILMDAAADPTAEVKLTRDSIKAFVLDIFTAGSDTTATTVEWMMAELLNHPHCLQKLRTELDAVVGRSQLVGEPDVAQMPYLQAVLKETLRLRPPAVFAQREAMQPIYVRGYTIPVKTSVFFNIFTIGRDVTWWEEPLEFRPERFMPGGAGEDVDPKGQHLQLMPFGSGRRACPGMGLAMQAVPAFLAALVQCFDWEVPNPPLDGGRGGAGECQEAAACAPSHAAPSSTTPTINCSRIPLYPLALSFHITLPLSYISISSGINLQHAGLLGTRILGR
uniref:Uncharacterized protein n=1 Tax=Aegilops tauschii subsp. strangulata TaxID=200361 RepID=A0A452XN36_AEGTS